MIVSAKRNIVAFEVEWYWRTCQDLRSPDPVVVTEAFDDLEVIQKHTDNETLKAQCQKMMRVMSARATEGRAVG
jgi:quinol monooxygenase YgiN